jgi:hypothetical protein
MKVLSQDSQEITVKIGERFRFVPIGGANGNVEIYDMLLTALNRLSWESADGTRADIEEIDLAQHDSVIVDGWDIEFFRVFAKDSAEVESDDEAFPDRLEMVFSG